MNICGVDEAGRGPVLGPLVMCAVQVPKKELSWLKQLGVADSKQLTKEKREQLYNKLIKKVQHELIILSPQEIDAAVLSEEASLNTLERDTTCILLKTLNPDQATIDCPDKNLEAYKAALQEAVPQATLDVRYKAEDHPCVAAASIIAKVTRDKELQTHANKLQLELGSGYPADPKTKAFLQEHWNNPEVQSLMRQSWETIKTIKEEKEQSSLSQF